MRIAHDGIAAAEITCIHYLPAACYHSLNSKVPTKLRSLPCQDIPTGGGRVRVHKRTVDNAAEIIISGVDIDEEHSGEIKETEAQQMIDRTQCKYRNRIRHLYRFWMETYPLQSQNLGTRPGQEVRPGGISSQQQQQHCLRRYERQDGEGFPDR